MKKVLLLAALASFLASCNVTESIVFNNDMDGSYVTGFDMSPMMKYANENRPSSVEKEKKEKMDTTIVFNEILKTYKDSIATLPEKERLSLTKLKDMVLTIKIDEEKNVFNFNMSKNFKKFDELKTIFEQVDQAMDYVKDVGNKDGEAPKDQLDEFTKTEAVSFSFTNNTFSRFQPNLMDAKTEDKDAEANEMKDMFMMQLEEVFSNAFYTLEYTFPKKIKSVSSPDALISEDGKTVTYKVSWSTINSDASVMNLDVILED